MTVVPNTRWLRLRSDLNSPREPAHVATERMILLKLSERAHLQRELKRVEAELAPLARAYADHLGEKPRPTPDQLRQRLGARP